ncbi:hypothetical protein [Persephonella sp.]
MQDETIFKEEWKRFHPIFQYPFLRSAIATDKNFATVYIRSMLSSKKKIEKIKIINFLSEISNVMMPKCDVLFYTNKFERLAFSLKHKNILSVGFMGGVKAFISSLKIKVKYFPSFHWLYHLMEIFEVDPEFNSFRAEWLVDQFISFLKSKEIKYIILPNDSLFFERFIIYCAKQTGVRTVCIQDGLFHSKISYKVLHGQFSDCMFLWGESQKVFYSKLNNMCNLKILGYPFDIKFRNFNRNFNAYKNKVCILGQPYENYNIYLGKKKKIIFEKIADLLKKEGFIVVYKPHPGELSSEFIPKNVKIYTKNLEKAFDEFGIFISLTSTALLEASLNKRIAIQVYDPEFKGDCFENMGYSYTINIENLENLVNFIKDIPLPYNVDENIIYVPRDVGSRLLKLLYEL